MTASETSAALFNALLVAPIIILAAWTSARAGKLSFLTVIATGLSAIGACLNVYMIAKNPAATVLNAVVLAGFVFFAAMAAARASGELDLFTGTSVLLTWLNAAFNIFLATKGTPALYNAIALAPLSVIASGAAARAGTINVYAVISTLLTFLLAGLNIYLAA